MAEMDPRLRGDDNTLLSSLCLCGSTTSCFAQLFASRIELQRFGVGEGLAVLHDADFVRACHVSFLSNTRLANSVRTNRVVRFHQRAGVYLAVWALALQLTALGVGAPGAELRSGGSLTHVVPPWCSLRGCVGRRLVDRGLVVQRGLH